jgi:hypothetical protein
LTVYTAVEVAGILKIAATKAEGLFRSSAIPTFRVGASRRCTKRALLEYIRAGGGSEPMPPRVKAELSARKRASTTANNARA